MHIQWDPALELNNMCICLLPVTVFSFEFAFARRDCAIVNYLFYLAESLSFLLCFFAVLKWLVVKLNQRV